MELYKKGSKGEMVKRIQRALHVMDDGIFGQLTEEAVKDLQRANGLKVDGIVGIATLTLLGLISATSRKKSKRYINEIIVHCTDTPAGKDYTVDDIRRWHKDRGWNDIGYHYVVYRDGSIHEGRNVDIAGAHCEGHNSHSIGVVYVGGRAREGQKYCDTRTVAQKEALLNLLKELRAMYPEAKIYGHRNFANKACPSFDAKKEYASL